MRKGQIIRETLETKVEIEINLDGSGQASINTGVGFLDHMLNLLAKHAFLDLRVEAKGDLEVDSHHTVEDCGLALGQALRQALGDKKGIHRYGSCLLPMDEALAQIALDFSGRPFLVWKADIPKVMLGNMEAEMGEEFFRAVAMESGMTLHVRLLEGNNTHHMLEAIFKGFARALSEAVANDPRVKGVMSSKGAL
ncbi:MAG: imidazoleglycerol-phosphate dehydratase HisB [Acidaminococcaceae bacterium]|jgi:imidazoleglycerol-phosphate dehydratase|nr:imidazoleglycerol-phosphate dehydratase HisB [Acidaminococcaceae bacterium]